LCYRPPLSQANISEITEAIMTEVAAEQKRRLSSPARAKQKRGKVRQAARLRSAVQPLSRGIAF